MLAGGVMTKEKEGKEPKTPAKKRTRSSKQGQDGVDPTTPSKKDKSGQAGASTPSPLQGARWQFNRENRRVAVALLAQSKCTESDPISIATAPKKPAHSGEVNKMLASLWATSTTRANYVAPLPGPELKRRKLDKINKDHA